MPRKILCLTMIVKNESHIIADTLKCLLTKIPFQYWVICDTGSTDGTQEIIRTCLKDVPGELHEVPWVNFGTNRTQVLNIARGKADYSFMFDADDTIEGAKIPIPTDMTHDIYELRFTSIDYTFFRPVIFSNRRRWSYVGVLHEYIDTCDDGPLPTRAVIQGDYACIAQCKGSRSTDPQKFYKDAITLSEAYESEVDPKLRSRYAFYCANSFRDCNMLKESLQWYATTLRSDGWTQEKYVACDQLYQVHKQLGNPEHGLYALVESFHYDRDRVECANALINYYMIKEMNEVAYKYFELVNPDFDTVDLSNKLLTQCNQIWFFFPYNIIILSDRVKKPELGIRMYNIIFKNKYVPTDHFFLRNLFGNLKFFLPHVVSGKKEFITKIAGYKRLCQENGFTE